MKEWKLMWTMACHIPDMDKTCSIIIMRIQKELYTQTFILVRRISWVNWICRKINIARHHIWQTSGTYMIKNLITSMSRQLVPKLSKIKSTLINFHRNQNLNTQTLIISWTTKNKFHMEVAPSSLHILPISNPHHSLQKYHKIGSKRIHKNQTLRFLN